MGATAACSPAPSVASASASPLNLEIQAAEALKPIDVWNDASPKATKLTRLSPTTIAIVAPVAARAGYLRNEYSDPASGEWLFGWVHPVDRASISAVTAAACPRPDAAHVLGMFPFETIECFGSSSLDFERVYLATSATSQALYTGDPAWLASPSEVVTKVTKDGDAGAFPVHFDPSLGGAVHPDGWYRIRAHFDDPRSRSCSRTPTGPPLAQDSQAEQILWCRQQLVVTALAPTTQPP